MDATRTQAFVTRIFSRKIAENLLYWLELLAGSFLASLAGAYIKRRAEIGMRVLACAAMTLITATDAMASNAQDSCSAKPCEAGSAAVTYATKKDPYYACPTRQLAIYTNFVLGLLAFHVSLTGKMPNISDRTGEPEYLDSDGKPNETRLILDALRSRTGIATFDQAVAKCSQGRGGQRVTVMNSPSNETVIWVSDDQAKTTFWMPKSNLDMRR